MVVESANIYANAMDNSYDATVPPGRHTIRVVPFSLHYLSEGASVEVTVLDIGKAELKITAGHWPFSMHICQMVGRYGQPYHTCTNDYATIPLNALLTS